MALSMPIILTGIAEHFAGEPAEVILWGASQATWLLLARHWVRREKLLRKEKDPDEAVLHAIKWLRIFQLMAVGAFGSFLKKFMELLPALF